MERHVRVKSLVYKYRVIEICGDKTNATRSSTRLEQSGSRGLRVRTWYLMEKEIHLTKDEDNDRKSRLKVFDVLINKEHFFIICGLQVWLLLVTQKKNTSVGLQIAWCLSTVMANVRKTWKINCREHWHSINLDSTNLTLSSAGL